MLYTMVSLATHHAFNMRLKLIDLKILPEVVLRLTVVCSDVVCILFFCNDCFNNYNSYL